MEDECGRAMTRPHLQLLSQQPWSTLTASGASTAVVMTEASAKSVPMVNETKAMHDLEIITPAMWWIFTSDAQLSPGQVERPSVSLTRKVQL